MSKLNGKWFVVVNPAGGAGRVTTVWPQLHKRLKAEKIHFHYEKTAQKGHAIQLIQHAVEEGYQNILAVGGDGTMNEVVNGIFLAGRELHKNTTFALFPVGTGNDWIKTWGISRHIDDWFEMFHAGRTVRQDIGVVNYQLEGETKTRYFANVAGLAYDAFVVAFAEGKRVKRWSKIFFLFMVLRCLFMYRYPTVKIESEKVNYAGKVYTINLGICRYSGGGMQLVPHADPQDGKLALTIAQPISKLGVLLNTWRFYSGTLGNHKKVKQYQVSSASVTDENNTVQIEVDGELLGTCPCSFTILPRALHIIVP